MMVMEKSDLVSKLDESLRRTASRMGIEASKEGLERITAYALELERWNRAYNLVARRIGVEGFVSLLVDAISPLCIRGLFDERKEVLDIGSGAGLPGIPLYLMVGSFPLTLVESQRKKITFLRHIKRKLVLEDIRVYPGRLEGISKEEDHLNAYEIALARAVMDPMRLIKTARPLLCEGGRVVLYMGKGDADRIRKGVASLKDKGYELEALRSTQRFVGKENYLAVIRKTSR
jgi:16S rRNA (guanine527-N7)-methyltransferase